jgi:hypothetical protein
MSIPPAIFLWLWRSLSESLEPPDDWYFASLSSAFTALGLVAGVAVRHFANRDAKPS